MNEDFLKIMKLLRDGGIPHVGQLAIISAILIADKAADDEQWPIDLYGEVACIEIKRLAEQI